MPPSFFTAQLSTDLALDGTETKVYVNSLQTLTGETITFSELSPFTRGVIIIDPEADYSQQPEIIAFTGIDEVNLAFTGITRGLSAISSSVVTANKVYHGVGTPVIISWGGQNISDLIAYVQGLIAGEIGSATDVAAGSTFLTENLGTQPRARHALVSQNSTPNMTLTVNNFATTGQTGLIVFSKTATSTMTAPVSNPRVDLVVYSTQSSALAIRTGIEGASPSTPAPLDGDIPLCEVYHRQTETTILERDTVPNTQGYIRRWYEVMPFGVYPPPGVIQAYGGTSAPSGYVICDGTAYSRTSSTYVGLYGAIGTNYGVGNGTSTFNVPNLLGRTIVGVGTGTVTATISSITTNVITATGLTNNSNNEFQTGQAVVFNATTAGNLVNGTTYYVVRTGVNTFSLATTLLNAQAPTVITLAGTETGNFLLTFTTRNIGDTGGEENHAMSQTEMYAHTHPIPTFVTAGSGSEVAGATGGSASTGATSSKGGNAAMQNMQPFAVVNYIIKL